MKCVADRLLDLVFVQLLMKVFPNLLSVMVSVGKEVVHGFIVVSTGGAYAHLRRVGCLVTIIEGKPLMSKF